MSVVGVRATCKGWGAVRLGPGLTECSKPSDAKMVMIMRMARALETRSAAAELTHTAVVTSLSWLGRMLLCV